MFLSFIIIKIMKNGEKIFNLKNIFFFCKAQVISLKLIIFSKGIFLSGKKIISRNETNAEKSGICFPQKQANKKFWILFYGKCFRKTNGAVIWSFFSGS